MVAASICACRFRTPKARRRLRCTPRLVVLRMIDSARKVIGQRSSIFRPVTCRCRLRSTRHGMLMNGRALRCIATVIGTPPWGPGSVGLARSSPQRARSNGAGSASSRRRSWRKCGGKKPRRIDNRARFEHPFPEAIRFPSVKGHPESTGRGSKICLQQPMALSNPR